MKKVIRKQVLLHFWQDEALNKLAKKNTSTSKSEILRLMFSSFILKSGFSCKLPMEQANDLDFKARKKIEEFN
jgi:hypothetical protein